MKRKTNHGTTGRAPRCRSRHAATATSGKIHSARASFTGTATASDSAENRAAAPTTELVSWIAIAAQ